MKTKTILFPLLLLFSLHPLTSVVCLDLMDEEIQRFQTLLKDQPVGVRIAFWAEKFMGVPYDVDPMGEYVSKAAVVADERVDCMYLVFRAVELALSQTPEDAVQIALDKRFHSKGILQEDRVANYEDRFEYGEDMIYSGKWGREVTSQFGKVLRLKGSRNLAFVDFLPSGELIQSMEKLKSGDLLFFVKAPESRVNREIVGHIGIVKVDQTVSLIHASGTKKKGGAVQKVLLKDYLQKMPFIGVKITRFE